MDDKIKAKWMAQFLGQIIINKPYTGFPPSEKDFFTENGELMYVYCDRQRYWCFSVLNNNSLGHPNEDFSKQPIQDGALLLRTVDMLTNEELIQVSILSNGGVDELETDQHICNGKYQIRQFKLGELYPFEMHQYLLRIGILLSFTHLNELNQPVTLTPDEIIKMGWVKLLK